MLGRMRPPGLAWLVIFLFPSIFVYDSNIGASADHYLAFFSAPLFLAAVGTARTLVPRWWILLAVIASGATLTKVQGAYIVVPAVGLVLAAFVRRLVARSGDVRVPGRIQRLLVGPLVALGCALLLTAPHFLKNIVYHRNPLYPFAQGLFTGSTPSFRGAGVMFDNLFAIWHSRPPSAPLARLKFGLEGMVAFSFAGNGYFRNVPYIGSLFTLSLPMFPFVGGVRRLWPGVAMAVGSLTMWAFMYRVDRNVQIFLPLMAAATAALLVRGWELGKVARVGIVALVAVQATWGADLAFSGQERIDVVPALIRSGINGQAKERFANYRRPYVELGRALPKNAVVLLHNTHQHLGIDRRLLLDWLGFQGLIDHRTFRSSLDIYRRFRELGVTHVVDVHNQHRAATMQEELLFGIFFSEYPPQRTFGSLRLLTLPSTPPPVEPPLQVMLIGIPTQRDGLYDITDLSNLHDLPPDLQFFPPPRAAIAP